MTICDAALAVAHLTDKQRSTLVSIARGQPVKVAARAEGISPNTVKDRRLVVYRKLRVDSAAQAAVIAAKAGLV